MEPTPNVTILYVEDDEETRQLLENLLRKKYPGFTVHTARNGPEGIALFHEHRPDIVLTDISLPGMNGMEMAAEIKKTAPETIVIAVTAYSDVEYLAGTSDSDISHYIRKPVEFERLFAAVEKSVEVLVLREKAGELDAMREAMEPVEGKPNDPARLPSFFALSDAVTGEIEEVSDGFLRATGFGRSELIGKRWRELGILGDEADQGGAADPFAGEGAGRSVSVRFKAKNGAALCAAITVDCCSGRDRKRLFTLWTLTPPKS